MLGRHIQYIYNEGMYQLHKEGTGEDVVDFVGGSPIVIRGTGGSIPSYPPPYDYSFLPYVEVGGAYEATGSVNTFNNIKSFLGVVQHNRKTCEFTNKVAVIKMPAIVTLFKGKALLKEFQQAEEYFPYGYTEDDPIHPIYLGTGESLQAGSLLMPAKVSIGGKYYSVWVLATAEKLGYSSPYDVILTLPARVQSVYPSPLTPTNLNDGIVVVEIDNFVVRFKSS